MNAHGGDKESVFEIAVVVPKKHEDQRFECVEVLVHEFHKVGFLVDRVVGLQNEYIKVCSVSCYFLCIFCFILNLRC